MLIWSTWWRGQKHIGISDCWLTLHNPHFSPIPWATRSLIGPICWGYLTLAIGQGCGEGIYLPSSMLLCLSCQFIYDLYCPKPLWRSGFLKSCASAQKLELVLQQHEESHMVKPSHFYTFARVGSWRECDHRQFQGLGMPY